MKGKDRREAIINKLVDSHVPLPGTSLAKEFGVSRQVIVQDIALLRAAGNDILSTNQGYVIQAKARVSRVFKTMHTDEDVQEEMELIVDLGGIIKDVFVYHKVYGVLKADMNIKSRLDINIFVDNIKTGKSSLLKNITSGYHYHTVYAENERVLDMIQENLQKRGFLAPLQDYEPVNFWEA